MFETSYQPLSGQHPEWGNVAVLPWDCDIFGFPVADFQAGDSHCVAQERTAFGEAFTRWTDDNRVEVVGCSVAAADKHWCGLLPTLGFAYVDYTLTITQPRMNKFDFPPTKIPVRLATPEDQPEVERIAEQAFEFGRYHVDPLFPHELSEYRYRRWLRNAFTDLGPNGRIYVTGETSHVGSFFHVNLKDDTAYITIIAVARELQRGTTGIDLCSGALNDLKMSGIRRVSSKISAANTGVMNFAAFFGFRFSQPQAVFHWHRPNSAHLVKPELVFGE